MQLSEDIALRKRNILVKICYDGKRYHGWQIQKNALSIQEVFQEALYNVLSEKPDIKGCSRTDAFVHANEYCINFPTSHTIPCERLVAALNRHLPKDIAVTHSSEVPADFHARYSCKGKEYIYKIWNSPIRNPFLEGYAFHYWYPLDVALLNAAAEHYIGRHDFTSFCTTDQRERINMVRNVTSFSVKRSGDLVTMSVEADGFLYNMVRILVGTLLRVAQKKISPSDIPKIIAAKNRNMAGPTAQPCGLYLNRVYY